jgi:hypothetical protein
MIGRRMFILSTFLFSIVLFGDKKSPSNLTLRFACFAGRFLRRLCVPSLFSYFTNHCCERLQFNVARDYNSMLREITLRHYEISRFIIARYHASSLWEITLRCYSDYIRISIIQSAVRFDRRYEWTADGLFSRPFFFQLFFLAIKNPRPILLSATSSPLSPVYSYGGYATPPFFHTLQFIVARDYNSMLLRSRFIITRYHASSLWVITLHHYEISRFDVARDYNSMLREITLVFELYNPP